jgi:hypothetical protein
MHCFASRVVAERKFAPLPLPARRSVRCCLPCAAERAQNSIKTASTIVAGKRDDRAQNFMKPKRMRPRKPREHGHSPLIARPFPRSLPRSAFSAVPSPRPPGICVSKQLPRPKRHGISRVRRASRTRRTGAGALSSSPPSFAPARGGRVG